MFGDRQQSIAECSATAGGAAKYPLGQCIVIRCTRTWLGGYRFVVKRAHIICQMPYQQRHAELPLDANIRRFSHIAVIGDSA